MSSILRRGTQLRKLCILSRQTIRFSNINRNFKLLTFPELRQSALVSNLDFQRNLGQIAHKFQNGEGQQAVSDVISEDEYIDHVLSKIEGDVKRFGHALRKDVDAVFNQIKKSGAVSSIQSLYLIRCCGSLLTYEAPPHRIVLVEEIWNKLQELGVPMDASHYNSLLKSYLENEHQFSPPEFLSAMERNGVAPNRVTYQRIIEKYCRNGDLSGASAILEHMKEKDFPINENIFNNLVLGHARARDMQGAVNMLSVMRKSELEPSSETYATLACGFAENCDMEGFSNILREAEEKQLYFTSKNYLQMFSALATSGNIEYADEILEKVDTQHHRTDIVNTVLSLLYQGFDDAAYKIVSLVGDSGFKKVFYLFFKGLASKETSPEKIIFYCQECLDKGLHEYSYEDALKAVILYGKSDHAFELLKEMKKVGRPLRCHYFWPILAAYGNNKDVEGIWSTLKFMGNMAIPANLDTYLDYVLPHLTTSDPEALISKVKELGQSDATFIDSLFLYFCCSGQLKEATDFRIQYKPQYTLTTVFHMLSNLRDVDSESVVMFLRQLSEDISDPESGGDVYGMFLDRLFSFQSNNIPLWHRYIEEYRIQGIKLPTTSVDALFSRLRVIAPQLTRPVQNLEINAVRDQHQLRDAGFIQPSQMTLEQLENSLAQKKGTGENVRPVLRHLLTHYCRRKDLQRAVDIKAEMDAINFTYSPAAYALLVNLYVLHDNLEEAMKYKKAIDEEYPHFKLDAAKAIDYITLMIKCDKSDEALEMINSEAESWLAPRYDDLLVTSIKKLLHAAAETGNVEITHKLFEKFVLDLKFASKHYTVFEPLVKVHMVRNDCDAAIEEYTKCVLNHNVFPSRNFLFKKFITMKDPERLQRVVDISVEHGGKEIALHELAAAFVECECIQEARKVMQTLGNKADMKQLDVICYRFFKQDKVLELEQFIGITKDLHHIDRDQLYVRLLDLYSQNNDHQAALELWNSMQEENVQPSSHMLQKLAELLEKNDQPIPFVVPLRSEFQNSSDLMKHIQEKNEVETVDVLKRMKKGEVHLLTPEVFTQIVDLMLEKKYLKEIVDIVQVMSCILAKPSDILKPVANKYAEAGDIDSLKLLYDCMPEFAHKYMDFNANFFHAYLASEQPELLLDELEKNLETTKKVFSSSGFLMLLQSYPHLFDRATKLIDAYLEKENFDIPKMVLWLHYFLQEKFEEAEVIYKQHSTTITKKDFAFQKIIHAVRSTQNETLGRKLVDLANISLKNNFKFRAYSSLLDVLVHKEKLEEAVALIGEANSKGVPTEKFFHPTLVSLKQSLTEKNMPVPFVIPSEGEDSGSSSSDSE